MKTSQVNGLDIRRYREGDETAILSLWKRVFQLDRTPAHWYWLNRNGPCGPAEILSAWDGDTLAAQYQIVPLEFLIDGRTLLGSLSLDEMTAPEYGGRKLFSTLGNQLYEELGVKGNHLTYGFPNANSARGIFHRLGWSEFKRLPIMVKPLNLQGLIRRYSDRPLRLLTSIARSFPARAVCSIIAQLISMWRRPNGQGSEKWTRYTRDGIRIKKIGHFDESFDAYWADLSGMKDFRIGLNRNSRFLTWRYLEKPNYEYAVFKVTSAKGMEGFAVVRTTDRFHLRVGFILEFTSLSEAAAEALYDAAMEYFKLVGTDIASLISTPSLPETAFMAKKGFFYLPRMLYPKELYFGARATSDQIKSDIFDRIDDWYLSWGDTDLV